MARNFTYLGCNLLRDYEATCQVKCLIAHLQKLWYILLEHQCFLIVSYLLILTTVPNALVISILLHDAEKWKIINFS